MATLGFCCVSSLLLLATGSMAVFSPAEERQVEDFVRSVMACYSNPGLSIAVVKGNQSWTRGFGLADVGREVNVTSSTLFALGSNSKAFTVAVLGMALQASRFTWDSRLQDILGSDFQLNTTELSSHVTLRDILSHRTGLPRAEIGILAGFADDVTPGILASRLRYLEPTLPFRDRFQYNNWMYSLVGHVVSVLLGQSWEEVLRTRLYEPLGMRSSRVMGKTVEVTDDVMAKPYFLHNGQLQMPDIAPFRPHLFEPAGGVASTADDMTKWLRFLLREGKTEDGRQLLEQKVLRECFQVAIPLRDGDPGYTEWWPPLLPISHVTLGYGYAWFKDSYRGRKLVWHAGGLFTYISYILLFPDLDSALYVGESGPMRGSASHVISLFLADLLLGESPFLNHSTACTYPAPWVTFPNVTSDTGSDIKDDVIGGSLAPFLGLYGHRLYGDVRIEENTSKNGLYFRYGLFEGRLNRTSDPRAFLMDMSGPLFFLAIDSSTEKVVPWPVKFKDEAGGVFQGLDFAQSGSSEALTFRRGMTFEGSNTGVRQVVSAWIVALVLLVLGGSGIVSV